MTVGSHIEHQLGPAKPNLDQLIQRVLNIGYRRYTGWQNYIFEYHAIYYDMTLNTWCHYRCHTDEKNIHSLNYLNKFKMLIDIYLGQFAQESRFALVERGRGFAWERNEELSYMQERVKVIIDAHGLSELGFLMFDVGSGDRCETICCGLVDAIAWSVEWESKEKEEKASNYQLTRGLSESSLGAHRIEVGALGVLEVENDRCRVLVQLLRCDRSIERARENKEEEEEARRLVVNWLDLG